MKSWPLALLLGHLALSALGAELSLAGTWQLQLDPRDEGVRTRIWEGSLNDAIPLPGTTTLAGKGKPLDMRINLERPAMQSLHQRFSYVGPAWYRRTVKIPADWKDQEIGLELERVIWESRVWVNGQEVGAPQLSLTTPHRYDLTRFLKAGEENTITIRIDNREKIPIGVLGHSYTNETQTIWNGIVGRIALDAKPKLRVETLKLRPDVARNEVEISVGLINHTGQPQKAPLKLGLAAGASEKLQTVDVPPGDTVFTDFLPLPPGTAHWSEFTPVKHAVTATLGRDGSASTVTDSFGVREFKAEGRRFAINGQPTFLRGTVQCAEFPQTGHPDMAGPQWEKIFTTAKAYGLNHLRFHSWCPPRAAFEAADRLGFYLQVELPNWTFNMGKVPAVDAWLRQEALNIFREYGNHPSFVLFSMGNELEGDFLAVDARIAELRKLEPRMLFTSTTFSFSPRGKLAGPQDDFFISQQTKSGWVRGQGFLNETVPNTVSDYAEGAASISIPLVTHEVGQYVVYPNLAELPKYDPTPMRATAWEAIKADLEKKGRLEEGASYTQASGKLAVLLYKEDLERALRTKDLAGIQLLQLQDFPGQSTATVGVLDAFWDSKGFVRPEEFRRFCAPTVPLIRMAKMVYTNREVFEAAIEMANFGPAPLKNAPIVWRVKDGDRVIGEGKVTPAEIPLGNGGPLGKIVQPLTAITKPAQLDVTVKIPGTPVRNDWRIWVYPVDGDVPAAEVEVFSSFSDKVLEALRAGKSVLLLPDRASVRDPIDARFIPVFWSPLHFPKQPGTLGALIDDKHPIWRGFPTGTHTDWQWWELTSHSFALDLGFIPVKPSMPFRFVDKYNRNALPAAIFEAKVGAGRLLVCTLDIANDLESRPTAQQLRRSVLAYMNGNSFRPHSELSAAQLTSLFGPPGGSSSSRNEPAADVRDLGIVPGFNDKK